MIEEMTQTLTAGELYNQNCIRSLIVQNYGSEKSQIRL